MKNLIFLITTSLVLSSCTDSNLDPAIDSNFSKKSIMIEDISNLLGDEQIEFYLTLSHHQKKELWLNKIDSLIELEPDTNYKYELNNYRNYVNEFDFEKAYFKTRDLNFFE